MTKDVEYGQLSENDYRELLRLFVELRETQSGRIVTASSGRDLTSKSNWHEFESPSTIVEILSNLDVIWRSFTKLLPELDKEKLVLRSWINVYDAGCFANPHRDGAGILQCIICISSGGTKDDEGSLVIERYGQIQMKEGEFVVFDATKLEHYTTPSPATERVTLILRIY